MDPTIIQFPPSTALRSRIIKTASGLIFARGYSEVTMDEIAWDLGISKKTLYLHFPSKQSLATEVIDAVAGQVRASAEAILDQTDLTFPEKLSRLLAGITERLSQVTAPVLRDLQRHAPEVYERIEAVRGRAIPFIFSRILEEGRQAGAIRSDVNFSLAIEYHLRAVQGLINPESLAKLAMTPAEAAEQALRIFFHGMLLDPPGRTHEKRVSR